MTSLSLLAGRIVPGYSFLVLCFFVANRIQVTDVTHRYLSKSETYSLQSRGHMEVEVRLYIDKLGVFHANQISMCLDPHLN